MSQGEKSIVIEAGRMELPVPSGGDFIFLKESARPVKIIVNEQTILMREGDKRRLERKPNQIQAFDSFKISNDSNIDLKVTFVTGRGDFQSQIVSGELQLAEVIKTAALETNLLPVEYTKTFGIVSTNKITRAQNEHIVDGDHWGSASSGWAAFDVADSGRYLYIVINGLLKTYDYDINFLGEVSLSSALNGAARGVVFHKESGKLFVNTHLSVYSIALDGTVTLLAGFPSGGAVFGAGIIGDTMFINTGNTSIRTYNVVSGEFGAVTFDYGGASGYQNMKFDADKNEFWFTHISADAYVCDGSGNYLRYVAGVYGGNASACIRSARNRSYSVGGYEMLFSHTLEAEETNGTWYIQDGTDVATRRNVEIFVDGYYTSDGTDTQFNGEVAKGFLQCLKVGGGVPDDYLDYLISLNWNDGQYALEKNAGSQSWAYRGYSDFETVQFESEMTIKVLPNLLTDAL